MSYLKFESFEEAYNYGVDPSHVAEHMIGTVMCVFEGDLSLLDKGFFFSFRDRDNRTWTLSVIPEDGGVITDALIEAAQEEA
jgi:hypothetical protein